MADIWRSIQEATFVVADLSGRNPNVLYELGLAHAVQKPAVLLSQQIDDIPFDLRSIRCLIYQNERSSREALRSHLIKSVTKLVLDLKIDPKRGAEQYAVLSRGLNIDDSRIDLSAPESKALKAIKSGDPKQKLRALKALVEFSKRDNARIESPTVMETVLNELKSPYDEIKLTAIEFIGKHGSSVHSYRVHEFLENSNPALQTAAINAISELHDENAVQPLLQMLSQTRVRSVRKVLIEALGKIGNEETIAYCLQQLRPAGVDESLKIEALEILGDLDRDDSIEIMTSLDLKTLSLRAKGCLADQIAKFTCPPELLCQKLENLVLKLARDKNAGVKGRAFASWCLRSLGEEAFLSRDRLWSILRRQNSEVVAAFFDALTMYDPFIPNDERHLLELAGRLPLFRSRVVYAIHEIGGPDAVRFMLSFLKQNSRGEDRQWALVYFARIPSVLARDECKKEMQCGTELFRRFLAATCLAKLGVDEAKAFLIKNASNPDVYPWVKEIARPILANKAKARKASE
jgi:HEAT repeat protein